MTAWWIRPLLIAAALAALLGAFAAFVSHERGVGAAKATAAINAAHAKGFAEAAAAVAADEARKRTATEKAHAEDIQRADARITAELDNRARLERLLARSAIAGRAAEGSPPPTGPGADGEAHPFRRLFEACAVEYGSLGQDAGRLADQVIGLQSFLLANEIGGSDAPVAGERPRTGSHSLVTQPASGAASVNSRGGGTTSLVSEP